MKLLLVVVRYTLGVLLLYSGLGDIRHPFEFLQSVDAYRLTGPASGLVVAALVPWLDVVGGLCLVSGLLLEGAFAAAVLLMGIFSIAICTAWVRGLGIRCGCFGGGRDVIDGLAVVRSLFLLLLAAAGFVFQVAHARSGPAARRRDISRRTFSWFLHSRPSRNPGFVVSRRVFRTQSTSVASPA